MVKPEPKSPESKPVEPKVQAEIDDNGAGGVSIR